MPVYWARLLANVVGQAAAEKLSYNATLASPKQALELGLVDQVTISAICCISCKFDLERSSSFQIASPL